MEVKTPADMENPFDLTVSRPLLSARFGCVALLAGAVISGIPLLAWLSLPVLLLVLVVVRGRHVLFAENLQSLPDLGKAPRRAEGGPLPAVALIVPVRNEEVGIEAAVRALAAIDYPALEILVIDDHSSDATPGILARLAGEFRHLRILAAPDIPEGWAGKTHASWFGFQQSNAAAQWLLFTDARVMFHPDAVRQAVAHAEAKRLGFLSCILRFDGDGLAEEAIAMIQNRGLVMSARAFGGGPPAAPFGLGQFMLVRREVYVASGGHSVAPAHPIEDFMLARSAHRCGATTAAAIAASLLSIRRYHGIGDMRQRVVRALRIAASDRVINLANRMSVELLFYVLPLPVAAAGLVRMASGGFQPAWAAMSLTAFLSYVAGTATPRACRTICGCRPRIVWLHPLAALLWTWLLLLAIADRVRGRGISWRGRAIHAPVAPGFRQEESFRTANHSHRD